jgi:hypothetical protein
MNPKTEPRHVEIRHTATPWKIGTRNPEDNTLPICTQGEGYKEAIASVLPRPHYADNQVANAALIVRAVNAHESLLKAAKSAVLAIEYQASPEATTQRKSDALNAALESLIEAIAKAEAE